MTSGNSASIFPHFCRNPQFSFSLKISAHGFSTPGKKSANIFFRLKKMLCVTIFCRQNGSWTHLRKKNKKNCWRKWLTNSSVQGEQEKRKKENGVGTHLVPKEDEKVLKEPQTTIFHLLTDKIGCKWEFRDIVEFRASAWLSKIPRSSLSPCRQSAPVSSLVAET